MTDPAGALRWGLTGLSRIASTPMAQVYRATRSGTPVVLKQLTALGQQHEAGAAPVLRLWDGDGAVRLLDASADALLLEPLDPAPLPRDDATAIPLLANVAHRLHRAAPGFPLPHLPHLRDRLGALAQGTDPRITRARPLAAALLSSAPTDQLLHGDLHHDNLLHSPRGWVALDPQPLIGDPAYDLANLFSNPLDHPNQVLAPGRAPTLAANLSRLLDLDPQRLLAWGYTHACLSATWALQDGADPSHRLAVADSIAPHLT